MTMKNCSECGRIFAHPTSSICQDCKREDERDFEKVRDFLREYKDTDINVVSERTGVSVNKITRYLREGRLLSSGLSSSLNIQCERCDAPIQSGRYCESCKHDLHKDMETTKRETSEKKSAKEKGKKKKKERMFIYDRIKRRK